MQTRGWTLITPSIYLYFSSTHVVLSEYLKEQFPWFLTNVVTSLYSGWFLMQYCPQDVPPDRMNTETMWLIYGFIAMISPVALWLAQGWMKGGFREKHEG